MIAIIFSRTVSNYNFPNSWKYVIRNVAIIIFRNVGNYNSPKYWQL